VIATVGNKAIAWDLDTLQQTGVLSAPRTGHHSATFSADGRRLVIGGDSRMTASVLDTGTGMELIRLPGEARLVRRVAFSHDSRFIAAGSNIQSSAGVIVWDSLRNAVP
jgi:WD40 repeat protein